MWDPLLDARIRKQRMPNLGRFSDDSDLEGESDLDIFGFSDVLPGSCSGTFFCVVLDLIKELNPNLTGLG